MTSSRGIESGSREKGVLSKTSFTVGSETLGLEMRSRKRLCGRKLTVQLLSGSLLTV